MHNAVMCTLSLYDVIGITRHLHIKLKSFSNIAQPLHKEAVRHCSFSLIIAKKSVIMSEAFLVDVSICLVWVFIYFHSLSVRVAKALTRICAVSSEPLVVENFISTCS